MSDTIHEVSRKVGKACKYAREVLKDDPEALRILDSALIDFGRLINNVIFLGSVLRSLESRSAEEIMIALKQTKSEVESRKKATDNVTVH